MSAVSRVAASTGQQHTSSLYSGQRHREVNYGPEGVQNVGIVAVQYVGEDFFKTLTLDNFYKLYCHATLSLVYYTTLEADIAL